MINNSFYINVQRGDYWRLWTRKTATLIYFRSLAEWGGGISVLSTLYICSLLKHIKKRRSVLSISAIN